MERTNLDDESEAQRALEAIALERSRGDQVLTRVFIGVLLPTCLFRHDLLLL